MVSYTGKLDVSFLQKMPTKDENSSLPKPTPLLTLAAQAARARRRRAESLQKKYDESGSQKTLSSADRVLLQELQSGKLHEEANEATKKSGFGRLKYLDGSFEDISRHGGGIVRSILASVQPEVSLDVDEATEEDQYAFCDFSE